MEDVQEHATATEERKTVKVLLLKAVESPMDTEIKHRTTSNMRTDITIIKISQQYFWSSLFKTCNRQNRQLVADAST